MKTVNSNIIADQYIEHGQLELKSIEQEDSLLAAIIEKRILLDAQALRGKPVEPWEAAAVNHLFEMHITTATTTTRLVRLVEGVFKRLAIKFNELNNLIVH